MIAIETQRGFILSEDERELKNKIVELMIAAFPKVLRCNIISLNIQSYQDLITNCIIEATICYLRNLIDSFDFKEEAKIEAITLLMDSIFYAIKTEVTKVYSSITTN